MQYREHHAAYHVSDDGYAHDYRTETVERKSYGTARKAKPEQSAVRKQVGQKIDKPVQSFEPADYLAENVFARPPAEYEYQRDAREREHHCRRRKALRRYKVYRYTEHRRERRQHAYRKTHERGE